MFSSIRYVLPLAATLFSVACNQDQSASQDKTLPGSKPATTTEASLTGAGATFPYPLYTKWISEYAKNNPNVKINYQSIGSGGGIRQISERTVDFGASDSPMNEEQLQKAPGILHIPTCIGAVVLTYNVEGVPNGLKLTPETIANVFLGKIKEWDDSAITKENPDLKLPHKTIATVHRSDGSGTTKIFVDYLTAISEDWKNGPGTGTSVTWPGGLGAKGNEGVAGLISSTPNSIGYLELAYAVQNKLTYAFIKNKSGQFVEPKLESITAAAAGAAAKMPDDLRVSIVNAEGEQAYPVAGFTYILLYQEQKDSNKGTTLGKFLSWAITDGQSFTKDLHYAPLPQEVVEKAKKKLLALAGTDKTPLLNLK